MIELLSSVPLYSEVNLQRADALSTNLSSLESLDTYGTMYTDDQKVQKVRTAQREFLWRPRS